MFHIAVPQGAVSNEEIPEISLGISEPAVDILPIGPHRPEAPPFDPMPLFIVGGLFLAVFSLMKLR